MVGVAQLVEPWIVIPVVVGSSPIVHPSYPRKPLAAGWHYLESLLSSVVQYRPAWGR
jgi:hypothetical protein